MKKIWITLVLIAVLIVAWLTASWYTGTHIEAKVGDIIARMNASLTNNPTAPGGILQIKQVGGYERGLLSSHARFALTNSLLGAEPVLESDLTISHGPFPLAALRGGNFLPQQFQAHLEVLATSGPLKMVAGALMGGKPPLVMDIGCSYGNHCVSTGSTPPIHVDLGALSKKAKLAFGGIQMQFDLNRQSDTVYKASGDVQLLPLSIGDQNFGSGQITITSDAQSATEVISWKTDQGASKLSLALATAQPMPFWGDPSMTPEDLPKLLKTVSAKLELSKPMAIDLAARALNLAKGVDPAAARQQIAAQFDAMLASVPESGKFVQTQGDLLISDWQYADGKLTVNGQENPELLARIKQGYLTRLNAAEQALPAGNASAPQPAGGDDGVPGALPPASAADQVIPDSAKQGDAK